MFVCVGVGGVGSDLRSVVRRLTAGTRCKLVPANRRGIGPVNSEITLYCDEKILVNTKLVQTGESIDTLL